MSLRPSTDSSRAHTSTVSPAGVAAVWERSTCVPSDCSAGQSRWGLTSSMHAHSTSATMYPVASTRGIIWKSAASS